MKMTRQTNTEWDRYIELVEELKSLDFLVINSISLNYHKKFFIKDSPYYMEISYSIYDDKINKAYLCIEPIRWLMNFESFFERQPEDIKEKIIFHLDLFR